MKLIIPRKTLQITNSVMPGGGYPEEAIEWINLNDSNINTFKLNTMDNNYKFKFSPDNKNIYNGAKYLGKGALTAVYKIRLESQTPINGYTIPDKYKDELILRIYDNNDIPVDTDYDTYKGKGDVEIGGEDILNDSQSEFINLWTEHKQKFSENIIDIFMYGEILLDNFYLGYYTITRTYGDHKKIAKFPLIDKIKYLKKLLEFLMKLRHNGYTYRDLKFPNIGFDKVGDEYNFIVLDYDTVTIMTKDQIEELKQKESITYTVGTYTPLYIYDQGKDFEADLMYVGGLLYTIKDLFDDLPNDNFTFLLGKLNAYLIPLDTLIRNYISKIDEKIEYEKNKDIVGIKTADTEINYIKRKINRLNLKEKELMDEIEINKYEDLKNIEDKITYIIGRIIKACILLGYDKVKELNDFINYTGLIKLLEDLIKSEEKPISVDILQKYLKYKQKYLKLKYNQ